MADPAKASLEVSRGRYSYGSYGEWRGMEANAPGSLWKEERSKGLCFPWLPILRPY